MSNRFSPVEAALEGLRVIRREPWAVVYWVAVWAIALAGVSAIRLATGALAPARSPTVGSLGVLHRFGPLAAVLAPTLLVLWVMTTAIVYRAVLRPGEHSWHLFKLGPDEARIAVLSALETILLAVLGGVPAYLLFVLFSPIFAAAPGQNRLIALLGAIVTVLLEIWIAVRLSLAPVQTFAERGFPFQAYWGFARGHYWRLLLSYLLVALEVLAFVALSLIVFLMFGALAEAAVSWRDPGLLRRGLLWLLVGILALLTAVASVVPSILICGCQAYAYRAIREARTPVQPA